MAKVSIVVPVYNVERYLEECLNSIKIQTLKDIEIICVDDGSTDLSAQILDNYAKKDNRFHVIHKQNEGYGRTMNIGISKATAPYVGIVESDDIIEPDMYEKLYALMEKNHADVIKADHYEFYEGGEGDYINKYKPAICEQRIGAYIPLTRKKADELLGLYNVLFNIKDHEEAFVFQKYTWSGLYSRKFLQEKQIVHNETPGASYQDNGFWFQTMIKAEHLYFTNQAFYHYRIDNLNSSIHSKGKVFAVCDEYDYIDDILNKMGMDGNRFYKWSAFFKIIDCLDNINRVSDEFKKELANRVKDELLLTLDKGHFDINLYADHRKVNLFNIFIAPELYVDKEKARLKRLDDLIGTYDMIIIYGAGLVGQRMQGILMEGRRNIKVKYFAVTELEGNPSEIQGVPVKPIKELKQHREKALVIISVGKKNEQAVEEILRLHKFSHYMLHSEFYE